MAFDAHTLLLLAAVAFLSAAVQGFTGFGFGLVGMSFCTYLVGPKDANILWSVLATGLVAYMWYSLREHVRWPLVACMVAGAAVGQPLGVSVLAGAAETALTRLVGAAIVVFAGYGQVNPHFRERDIHPAWGAAAGAVSGFFSGAASMGGPAVVIFLLLMGLKKNAIKGNLAAYFSLNLALKLGLLAGWKGMIETSHVTGAGLLMAPLLVGTVLGLRGARHVSTIALRRAVCALLLVPGALLLFG